MSLIRGGSAWHSNGRELQTRGTAPLPMAIDPLTGYHRQGLIAVSTLALASALATSCMLLLITRRMIVVPRNSKEYLGYNQYILLIYNLLLADFQQSLAFLLNIYWISKNSIYSPSTVCFLQGLWLQLGDVGSGMFALTIAAYTFMQVILARKIEHRQFVTIIIGIWCFLALMAVIPIASHGGDPFVPSNAWCWISAEYEGDRLWTHYFWIFLAEFMCIILYSATVFQLRRKIFASTILGNRHTESLNRLRRVMTYMVIYPIAYVILSLPLAAGRMATAQGHTPSIVYYCVAGSILTSSGFVDVLMYVMTRRSLILNSESQGERSHTAFHQSHHVATITAGNIEEERLFGPVDYQQSSIDRDGSAENITPREVELSDLANVYQKTTIEITSELAYPQKSYSKP